MTAPLVLIVDDEFGLRSLFATMIRRLGYDIVLAGGGAEAITILEAQTPDLIILDLAMPLVPGVDVLRYIVGTPRLDAMRVAVLTAIGPGPAPDDVAGRIDRWLNKPVRPDRFMELVREMVEGSKAS